jgi:hypothetical protein
MKHFAFLDVDQTLLYNYTDLNQELLNSLRNQGVNDIYLFTNMDLTDLRVVGRDKDIVTRHEIIQWIKDQGFTVHGVITPADTGNYDDHGQLKPIGTAYTELYSDLMTRLLINGVIDLHNYSSNPDDLADYFINQNQWLMASSITHHKINELPINEVSIPTLRICLMDNTNGAFVKWLDRDGLIEFFKSDAETKQKFRIDHQEDPSQKIQFKGGMSPNNKALMMQLAAGELIKQHGPIAISFFDDDERHLLRSKELMEGFERTGLLQLNTCRMSPDFGTSQRDEAIQSYKATLTQSMAAQSHEVAIETSLRTLNGWVKTKQQKTQAINQLRDRMPFANSSQMLKIADMAHSGYGIFDEVSLKTAYKCLVIAHLKARNPDELNETKMALLGFLTKHGIENINSIRFTDEQIGSIFDSLTHIPHHESKDSPAAKMLLNRLISLQLLILSSFNDIDAVGFKDEMGMLLWLRETKLTAECPQITRTSEPTPVLPELTLPVENSVVPISSSETAPSYRTEPSSSSSETVTQSSVEENSAFLQSLKFFVSKEDKPKSPASHASASSPSP